MVSLLCSSSQLCQSHLGIISIEVWSRYMEEIINVKFYKNVEGKVIEAGVWLESIAPLAMFQTRSCHIVMAHGLCCLCIL